MKGIFLFILLFASSLEARIVFSGNTAETKISLTNDNDTYILYFDGRIPYYDEDSFFYKLLDKALSSIPAGRDFTISLNSKGGVVQSVASISDMLKEKCQYNYYCRITTYVAKDAKCSSACISFYLLGSERLAHQEAIFGFHAMLRRTDYGDQIEPAQKAINEYVYYGASRNFLEGLALRGIFSSRSVTDLSPDELDGSNIIHRVLRD